MLRKLLLVGILFFYESALRSINVGVVERKLQLFIRPDESNPKNDTVYFLQDLKDTRNFWVQRLRFERKRFFGRDSKLINHMEQELKTIAALKRKMFLFEVFSPELSIRQAFESAVFRLKARKGLMQAKDQSLGSTLKYKKNVTSATPGTKKAAPEVLKYPKNVIFEQASATPDTKPEVNVSFGKIFKFQLKKIDANLLSLFRNDLKTVIRQIIKNYFDPERFKSLELKIFGSKVYDEGIIIGEDGAILINVSIALDTFLTMLQGYDRNFKENPMIYTGEKDYNITGKNLEFYKQNAVTKNILLKVVSAVLAQTFYEPVVGSFDLEEVRDCTVKVTNSSNKSVMSFSKGLAMLLNRFIFSIESVFSIEDDFIKTLQKTIIHDPNSYLKKEMPYRKYAPLKLSCWDGDDINPVVERLKLSYERLELLSKQFKTSEAKDLAKKYLTNWLENVDDFAFYSCDKESNDANNVNNGTKITNINKGLEKFRTKAKESLKRIKDNAMSYKGGAIRNYADDQLDKVEDLMLFYKSISDVLPYVMINPIFVYDLAKKLGFSGNIKTWME